MDGETLARVLPAAASSVALVLSLAGLYLQRRDRRPRLKVRVRYEYRLGPAGRPPGHSPGRSPGEASDAGNVRPRIHDYSQKGPYQRLGDFLLEHGLRGEPEGHPVVRFSLSNEGEKVVYLSSVRLYLLLAGSRLGTRLAKCLVLDPVQGKIVPGELAGPTANILGPAGGESRSSPDPVDIVPGDAVGYRFGLSRPANTLVKEGYEGDRLLLLEATDRVGNVYRCAFGVDTDLWALPELDGSL